MVIGNNIKIKINNQTILDNISFDLIPGSITCFIGKSGAGKTTLLKAISGLIPINSGNIIINNKELKSLTPKQRSEEIGYVFQNLNLFPHMTVLENCIDPLIVHGKTYDQAKEIALKNLKEFDIDKLSDRKINQLSGGQQQRVAICRALCLNPAIILLDEPTSSLDPDNTDILVKILKSLAISGLTICLSSQDMPFVKKIMDKVYYLEDGKITDDNFIKDWIL